MNWDEAKRWDDEVDLTSMPDPAPWYEKKPEPMPKVVDRCTYQVRVRFTGFTRKCGKSLVYLTPEGEPVIIALWHPYFGASVGPCCAQGSVLETLKAQWPEFGTYTIYDPVDAQAEEIARRRFRHAFKDEGQPKQGGLRRIDGSEHIW